MTPLPGYAYVHNNKFLSVYSLSTISGPVIYGSLLNKSNISHCLFLYRHTEGNPIERPACRTGNNDDSRRLDDNHVRYGL